MSRRAVRPVWVLEAVLHLVLVVSWVVAYFAARRSLADMPPGTRNYILALYQSDDRLLLCLALGLVGVAALGARHRWPTAALVAVSALVFLVEFLFPYVTRIAFATTIMILVAVFWALWRTERFRLLATLSLALGALVTVPRYQVSRNLSTATIDGTAEPLVELTSIVTTLQSMILVAVAVAAAALVRRFDAQAVELAERNRELTEERAASARAAVLDERVRISRELHDVVAHHVTTMTVHAGAARQVVAARPEAATESLHQIERAGRDAVSELHRLLGFLRGDGDESARRDHEDDDRAPVPSLRHLDRLVDSLGPGLHCELTVAGDLGVVPQSVDVSAYRIVQEALTNVLKHSTATRAVVTVDADGRRVALRVVDRGRPVHGFDPAPNSDASPGPADPGPGRGHGLVGMRERAALHGGRLGAGPDPDGGWLVEAELPYEPIQVARDAVSAPRYERNAR